MTFPTTKQEFRTAVFTHLGTPLNIFISILAYKEINAATKIKIHDFLKTDLRIQNTILPSAYIRNQTLSDYVDEIWELNKSYFEISLPSENDPKSRENFMGRSIIRNQDMMTWMENIENSKEWNSNWFSKLPYQERKYLMPVRGFEGYEEYAPDIQRFRISHIPEDVKFDDCFPTINELYIAHPYKPCVYMPVSRYEHLLFRDRIHEMSKVMMALGATEIRTIQNDEYKSYSKDNYSTQTSASGRVGGWVSGNGSYATGTEHSRNTGRESEIVINFKNDPLELPHIPEGLVWFNHESEWQQIAEARLNGNILEYELSLSSKQVNLVSDSERKNIEVQARAMFVSGSFSRETSSSSIFNEETAKSTRILIKFKSRKDY